jgi:hypothetical protein
LEFACLVLNTYRWVRAKRCGALICVSVGHAQGKGGNPSVQVGDTSSVDLYSGFGVLAIFAGFLVIELVVGLVIYVLVCTAYYKMYRKAETNHAWLAYIPIAQMWPFFWTIKKSAWNILWLLLPAVGEVLALGLHNAVAVVICIILIVVTIIVSITWQVRLFRAFGMNPLWLLMMIGYVIPFLNMLVGIAFIVLYCYMGFSSQVRYNPNFKR